MEINLRYDPGVSVVMRSFVIMFIGIITGVVLLSVLCFVPDYLKYREMTGSKNEKEIVADSANSYPAPTITIRHSPHY